MSKLFYVVIICFLFACSNQPKELNLKDYYAWINNTESGLIKQKEGNNIIVEVKYIPAEVLALKSFNRDQSKSYEQYLEDYNKGINFIMKIDSKNGDVMLEDVEEYADYEQKVNQLNFDIENLIKLRVGKSEAIKPVLTNFENTYGVQSHRIINIVFPISLNGINKNENIVLLFNDEIFRSGMYSFSYEAEKLKNYPKLKM